MSTDATVGELRTALADLPDSTPIALAGVRDTPLIGWTVGEKDGPILLLAFDVPSAPRSKRPYAPHGDPEFMPNPTPEV